MRTTLACRVQCVLTVQPACSCSKLSNSKFSTCQDSVYIGGHFKVGSGANKLSQLMVLVANICRRTVARVLTTFSSCAEIMFGMYLVFIHLGC